MKEYLLSVGWKPTQYNKSKKTGLVTSPKLTEDSFDSIKDGTGQLVARRNVIVHRRRTVENYKDPSGKGILSKVREDGRVPATGILCGTPTARTTHSGAVCNVPGVGAILGSEMRELFHVKPPYVQLGSDLEGIEGNVMAHHTYNYDGGIIYDGLLGAGDWHLFNAVNIYTPFRPTRPISRGAGKAITYSLIYGTGIAALALSLGISHKKAKELYNYFWESNEGLGKLKKALEKYYKHYGFLKGIDGRQLRVRHEYKLLNNLFQSNAAIIFKKWGTLANRRLREDGLDCQQIISYHDEYQYRCHEEHAECSIGIINQAAIDAGLHFNVRPPILTDTKVGMNWKDCH